MTTRWFAALRPPRDAVRDLAALVADVGLPRSTAPADWHITLAFCGELSDEEVPVVSRAIAAATADGEAPRLRLADMGTFGDDAVVFAAVTGDVARLRGLATALRGELDNAGIAYSTRPFQPHLTLSRPRRSGSVTHAQRIRLREYQGPEWTADAVRLYRTASGSKKRYETVERFWLGDGPA